MPESYSLDDKTVTVSSPIGGLYTVTTYANNTSKTDVYNYSGILIKSFVGNNVEIKVQCNKTFITVDHKDLYLAK